MQHQTQPVASTISGAAQHPPAEQVLHANKSSQWYRASSQNSTKHQCQKKWIALYCIALHSITLRLIALHCISCWWLCMRISDSDSAPLRAFPTFAICPQGNAHLCNCCQWCLTKNKQTLISLLRSFFFDWRLKRKVHLPLQFASRWGPVRKTGAWNSLMNTIKIHYCFPMFRAMGALKQFEVWRNWSHRKMQQKHHQYRWR